MNEIKQNETAITITDLNKKELQAVQMRYLGKTSVEIAQATGYDESYVRRLFMQCGRLERVYSEFAAHKRQETEAIANAVLERVKSEAKDSIERMIELSKKLDYAAVSFKANEFLLSFIGTAQDMSLRAKIQAMGFDEARKIVNEIFTDVFKMPLDEQSKVVIIRKSNDDYGKQSELNEY